MIPQEISSGETVKKVANEQQSSSMILLSITCLLIAGLLGIAGGNLESSENPTPIVELDIQDINANLVDSDGY